MFGWFKRKKWRVLYADNQHSMWFLDKGIARDYATIFDSIHIENEDGKTICSKAWQL